MIIKKDYGLRGITENKDNLIFHHIQDIDPTLKELNELRMQNLDGFTKARDKRYIGSIPMIEFERNPMLKEAMKHGCLDKAVEIFLRSDEGKRYVVNPINTGRSGHVRVK